MENPTISIPTWLYFLFETNLSRKLELQSIVK
jgi:hypothetical protein